jgi:hypothetical protein
LKELQPLKTTCDEAAYPYRFLVAPTLRDLILQVPCKSGSESLTVAHPLRSRCYTAPTQAKTLTTATTAALRAIGQKTAGREDRTINLPLLGLTLSEQKTRTPLEYLASVGTYKQGGPDSNHLLDSEQHWRIDSYSLAHRLRGRD